MEEVRRSVRIRNRRSISQTPDRDSASAPNLGIMGGQQFNIFYNRNIGNDQINPNLDDLLPAAACGQGDVGLFDNDRSINDENAFISLLTKYLKALGVILVLIILTLSLVDLNIYQREPKYCPLSYNILKQINMNNKNIRNIKQDLMKLNKGIEELMEWRAKIPVKTTEIKFDLLLEEKFNTEIDKALTLYDADKVGMIDYALESAGGIITSTPNTISFPSHHSYKVMGLINVPYPSNPSSLIQPGNLPGQCYAFKGHNGKIRIQLTDIIHITAVTIEHTHQNLVQNRFSAPKDFQVYGLETADSENGFELGAFTYSLNERPVQTFKVQKTNKVFEYVAFHILTNHGNLDYTCIYRVRVHGNIVKAPNRDLNYY